MSERKKQLKLDKESWAWWCELDELGELEESWCCQVIKEGNFEEEILRTLNALLGSAIHRLRVDFCIQCGNSLTDMPQVITGPEKICCGLSMLIEFAEIFDPRTADVHRLKGNYCFHCGEKIRRISHDDPRKEGRE